MNDAKIQLPVGEYIETWHEPQRPQWITMQGQYIYITPLQTRHAEALFACSHTQEDADSWLYMPYGPFLRLQDYEQWLAQQCHKDDPMFFAIMDKHKNQPIGVASYLNINTQAASIEVGHIHFSPVLRNSIGATEAMYLMMSYIFSLGYRRYEWKCNALNAKSRMAAQRLGFSYEGIFRQAAVFKNRNRDTAWFAMIDKEWPRLKDVYQQWLSKENFNADNQQLHRLSALTRSILFQKDPTLT